jgi:hypothetical protein
VPSAPSNKAYSLTSLFNPHLGASPLKIACPMLGGFALSTYARGLRSMLGGFALSTYARGIRPMLGGFALSTYARGLRPLDLRSGASPYRPMLGGFALLTYAWGLCPMLGGFILSTYARGLRPMLGGFALQPRLGASPFGLHDSSKFARSTLKNFPRYIHAHEISKTQMVGQLSAQRCPDLPSGDHSR